ncbi:hypothetical protein [Mammaliicoccus sp. A-M4]|uniref:hypothetical protein n=1 Tax=Mammaliicoccus sp. A-M4 TaxID=2898664 RepID=UPI001EFB5BCF|nr:hypothetical protein [Mammaliicoccus sp. A-M4]
MNLLKVLGQGIVTHLVAILFLMGLTLINVASYLYLGLVFGLATTGVSFILVALIYQFEQASNNQPPQ